MKLLRLFNSRINNKLILLSVIPVAVVTMIITWHTIDTRQAEIRDYQLRTAAQLAKNLAKISDFALYSGREDILAPLAESSREISSIAGIYFLNPDRTPLLTNQLADTVTPAMLQDGDYSAVDPNFFVVEEPVYQVDVKVSDYADSNGAESNSDPTNQATLLGWVVVAADYSASTEKAREILVTHLLISFSVLLGAILLSYILSNHVVAPVTDMTAVVRELERGNLNARIAPRTGDELAILANGINHLARAVAEGRDSLETRVTLATERLTKTLEDLQRKNRELDLAHKQAQAASTAKGDFLAQMSHELRTPITAIQGFVKLLTSSGLTSSQERYCNIIQQASVQLLQLIDDILDITRLQSNSITLEKVPFNLADCVEAPLSLMAPTAHDKGLELILDIAPNVPYLLVGDSLRIRQIIYNLITNAIKFTPAGYVLLRVTASPVNGDKLQLYVEVTDTGIGIPDKQQQKLFEPFTQADNSISRRFGGSGLGLSIVRKLLGLMDGDLYLSSTAGKGTSFFLTFPLAVQEAEQLIEPPSRGNVLLFDPHPQSRQALEHRLSRYVDTIDSCENFEDLEIGDSQSAPEIVIYAPPLDISQHQLEQELAQLREVCTATIAVLTSTATASRGLDGAVSRSVQPVRFVDKPPLSSELAKLFQPETESAPDHLARLNTAIDAKILAAEDNEFTRILLAAYFEHSNYRLTLVNNGQEALGACQSIKYDLILLDVHMPQVNGITALKKLKQSGGPNRDTPVIMLTADILQQEENALFDAGASDLVFKPFDESKLWSAINKHLRTPPAGSAAKGGNHNPEHKALFAEEVSRLTALAKTSLDNKDEDVLRETIHQLLGIAGVYRMTYLERAVQALHQAFKTGNGNKMFAAMETLELEVAKLREGV